MASVLEPAVSRTRSTRSRAKRRCEGSTYPASMKPRVFFAHRQGLARFTSPALVIHEAVQIAPCSSEALPEVLTTDVQELGADHVTDLEDVAQDVGEALPAVETEEHSSGARESGLGDQQSCVDGERAVVRRVEVGGGIESMAVAPEGQGLGFTPAALRVQDMVDHDAIEPGPKAAAPFERRQSGEALTRISWVASSASWGK
jgi:hypothetical protein